MNLIQKLPISIIINEIEPFTRSPMCKNVLYDIENYTYTFKCVYNKYCEILLEKLAGSGNITMNIYPENFSIVARMTWFFLEIEIFSFLCRSSYLYDVLDRSFNNICTSNIFSYTHELSEISNLEELDEFADFIDSHHKLVKTRVKRIWALMNNKERLECINVICNQ